MPTINDVFFFIHKNLYFCPIDFVERHFPANKILPRIIIYLIAIGAKTIFYKKIPPNTISEIDDKEIKNFLDYK